MKTLKSLMFGLALLVASTVVNASNKPSPAALTKNDVLNIYINAVVHGKIDELDNILANDVKYTIYRGDNEVTLNKQRILESFKATENTEQGCTYVTSIMDETKNSMVVKLILRYDGYVRTNLITISLNKADFKITKIETQS